MSPPAAPSSAGSARILEINHIPWVKLALPEQTEQIDTEFTTNTARGLTDRLRAGGQQLVRLMRLCFGPPFDLVFCRALSRFNYLPRYSAPLNAVRWLIGMLVNFCVWMQVRRGARLAVVDLRDECAIDSRDLFLLRLSTCYFKRELPQNIWNVYMRAQPPHGEFNGLTRHPGYLPHLRKFQPVSIGISAEKIRLIEEALAGVPGDEKTLDVFYAGPVYASTVRQDGLRCLEELARRGYRVECFDGHLPFGEFVRKMRSAWLVWSPEGQGWDCYRHYEVCVAGSVPLMNFPGLRRHEPLLADVHCVYYAVEGDDLCRQAERALADHDALRRMALAARAHVLARHTDEKLGLYMAGRLLELSAPV